MPTIMVHKRYRLFFFSNEGSPRERVHVHARRGAAIAKFWVEPEVALLSSYQMSASELRELEAVIRENADFIREKWNEHFGQ